MWFWSAGATNRKDLRQAVEYSRFIVETITASPVFEFIHIEPSKYWESLLFLDEQNFAGIEVSLQTLDDPEETESSSSASSSSSSAVGTHDSEGKVIRAVSNDSLASVPSEDGDEANEEGMLDVGEVAATAESVVSSSDDALKLEAPTSGTKKARFSDADTKSIEDYKGSLTKTAEDRDSAAYLLYAADMRESTKSDMEDELMLSSNTRVAADAVKDEDVDAKLLELWGLMDEAQKAPYLENLGEGEDMEEASVGDRRGRDDLEDEDSDDDIVAMTTRRRRKKERLSTVELLSRRRQMNSQLSDSDSDESGGELDPYILTASNLGRRE